MELVLGRGGCPSADKPQEGVPGRGRSLSKTGVAAGAGPGGLRVGQDPEPGTLPEDRGFGVGVTCPVVSGVKPFCAEEGAGSPGEGSGACWG